MNCIHKSDHYLNGKIYFREKILAILKKSISSVTDTLKVYQSQKFYKETGKNI